MKLCDCLACSKLWGELEMKRSKITGRLKSRIKQIAHFTAGRHISGVRISKHAKAKQPKGVTK